jgi:hypothetical protein
VSMRCERCVSCALCAVVECMPFVCGVCMLGGLMKSAVRCVREPFSLVWCVRCSGQWVRMLCAVCCCVCGLVMALRIHTAQTAHIAHTSQNAGNCFCVCAVSCAVCVRSLSVWCVSAFMCGARCEP